jgi:signal transduction histidine kinase
VTKLTDTDAQFAAFERHKRTILSLFPHGLLAISLLLTGASGATGGPFWIDAVLAAAASVWVLLLIVVPEEWMEQRARVAMFFAVAAGLAAALVIRAPWFGVFAWSGYIFTGTLLRRTPDRIAGLLVTAAVLGTSQHGGLPSGSAGSWLGWGLIVAMNVAIAGTFMWIGTMDEMQGDQRKRALDEATEANRRLREALEENAGLHRQLLTQAREAGILDERQRMAREIHDTLAQGLTGIITQLAAARQSPSEALEHQRHLDMAAELARESLREARRSVAALSPEVLQDAQLPQALCAVTERWTAQHGLPVELVTTGAARPLRPEVDVALLRAAQEGLANVAKHAGARRVGLTLSYMGDVVTLDVRDDGVGFDPVATPCGEGGFGLTAMRQRVQELGGTLEVESEPGGGTAISASVPASGDGAPLIALGS